MELLWCWLDIESKSYISVHGSSYACNHSSISKFGFNGGVYWHVNLIPFPYHTANQQGCGREIPDLYNCVVCRGDEKCSIRSLAQPCNVPARLFNKLHNLAAAAAALHRPHQQSRACGFGLFPSWSVNGWSILIAAFSIKLRWYWWILKPVLRLVMCTFKVCLC